MTYLQEIQKKFEELIQPIEATGGSRDYKCNGQEIQITFGRVDENGDIETIILDPLKEIKSFLIQSLQDLGQKIIEEIEEDKKYWENSRHHANIVSGAIIALKDLTKKIKELIQ